MFGEDFNMFSFACELYAQMAQYAIPAGLAFGLCNIIIQMFFGAVFGGKVKVGAKP